MPNEIDEIKSRLDIVDVVSEYVRLKQAGGNWKALCPFHAEKTPSFMVSQEKQIWHCFGCFPRGSLIKTQEGFHRIEEIKPGQRVLTHKARFMSVIHTLWRPYQGAMVDLKVRKMSEPVSLTADHKVFVIRTKNCKQKGRETRICQRRCKQNCPTKYFTNYKIEKSAAGKLTINDYLLYPINEEVEDVNFINLDDYYDRPESNLGAKITKLPKKIRINEDLLKLIGYWIAEGSNHRAYIRFSLSDKEEDFALEIIKLTKKVFGLKGSIHKRYGKKSRIEVTICNSKLANIFENLCGKGAENKHIPFIFEKLSPSKQRVILEAIFKGDGYTGLVSKCKTERKFKAITIISLVLAEQLRDILLRLKIMPTVTVTQAKIDKKKVNHKKSYTLHWQENNKAYYSDFFRDKNGILYWLLPIKEINKRKYEGDVFNLTVAKDHSYVTNAFAVGNCGEGGDIFSFVQKIENLEFPEALRILAQKAGVKLRPRDPQLASQRNKLLDICQTTVKFWHNNLLKSPQAKIARDYLAKRQVSEATIDEFNIGYAPDSWEETLNFLKEKGFSEQEIFLAGLTVKKEKGAGFYDRFRGRLIFPIANIHGDVIAFGGRTLKDEEGAKYINSPQTLIYNKSLVLYNLDKAKSEIKRLNYAILVEGYTDIVASWQAGVKNVIASSGTALTLEQVRLLKRYTNNLAIAFDADLAGEIASTRGIDVALAQELNVKVINLPEGKDPDELIRENPANWTKAIKEAQSIMEYYFQKTLDKLELSKVEDKKLASEKLLRAIAKIGNKVEQTHWLQRLSEIIKVPEEILRETLSKKGLDKQLSQEIEEVKVVAKDRMEMLTEGILAIALKFPQNLSYIVDHLKPEMLVGSKNIQLYKNLLVFYTENKDKGENFLLDFSNRLKTGKNNRDLSQWADTLILLAEKEFFDFDQNQIRNEVVKIINTLKKNYITTQLKNLEEKISQAEKEGRTEEIKKFINQFKELTAQLNLIDNNF